MTNVGCLFFFWTAKKIITNTGGIKCLKLLMQVNKMVVV